MRLSRRWKLRARGKARPVWNDKEQEKMEDQFSLSMRGFKGPVLDLKERKNNYGELQQHGSFRHFHSRPVGINGGIGRIMVEWRASPGARWTADEITSFSML